MWTEHNPLWRCKNYLRTAFRTSCGKNVPHNFKQASITIVLYSENSVFISLANITNKDSVEFLSHSFKENCFPLPRKTSALYEPALGSSEQYGVLLARSICEPHWRRPHTVPKQRCDASGCHRVAEEQAVWGFFRSDCFAVSFWQAFRSSTSFPPPSLPCGTRLTTTSRTWIAPPLRTSTRSCRSSSWNTSMPGPPALQVRRHHCRHAEQGLYLAEI